MNDVDIEEGQRLKAADILFQRDRLAYVEWLRDNAAAMFDAIETGRQWETIARLLLGILEGVRDDGWDFDPGEVAVINEAAAFRDVADRTPTPTDGTR